MHVGRFREFLTDVTGSCFGGNNLKSILFLPWDYTLLFSSNPTKSASLSSCFDEDVFVRNDRKNDEEASVGVRGEDADVSNDGQLVGWWSSGW